MAAAPVVLSITADASPLQAELSGKAGGAVSDFVGKTNKGFAEVAASSNKLNEELKNQGKIAAEVSAIELAAHEKLLVALEKASDYHVRMLGVVTRSANATSDAIDGIERAWGRVVAAGTTIKHFFETVGLGTAAIGAHTIAVDQLENAYRIARIVMSPSLFTASTLGAGIAVELLLKNAEAVAQKTRDIAVEAARTEKSFQSVLAMHTAGKIEGGAFSTVFAGKGIGEVTTLVNAYRELKDPVDKAAFAVEHFGANAEKAMVELRHDPDSLIDTARAADTLAASVTKLDRESLERLSTRLDWLPNQLHKVASGFREWWETEPLGKRWFATVIAGIADMSETLPDTGSGMSTPAFSPRASHAWIEEHAAEIKEIEVRRKAAANRYAGPNFDVLLGEERSKKSESDKSMMRPKVDAATLSESNVALATYYDSKEYLLSRLVEVEKRSATLRQTLNDAKGTSVEQGVRNDYLQSVREAINLREALNKDKLAEVGITATQQIAEAKIAALQEKTRAGVAAGTIKPGEEVAQQISQENALTDARRKGLEAKRDLLSKDSKSTLAERVSATIAIQNLESAHRLKLAEIRDAGAQKARAIQKQLSETAISGTLQTSEANIAQEREKLQAGVTAGTVSPQSETEGLLKLEDAQHTAKLKNLNERLTLEKDEVAIARIKQEIDALAITHETERNRIIDEGKERSKVATRQAQQQEIAGEQRIGELKIAQEREVTRAKVAAQEVKPAEEATQLTGQENKSFKLAQDEINKKRALLDANNVKDKEQLKGLAIEEEALAIAHRTRLNSIDDSGIQKEKAEGVSEVSRVMAEENEKAEFILKTQQMTNANLLSSNSETQGQWLKSEQAALDKWHNAHVEAIRTAAESMVALGGLESKEYKDLIKKLIAEDDQYALKKQALNNKEATQFKQFMKQFQTESNNALTHVIMGTEKWGKAWHQVLSSMTSSLLTASQKWVETVILHEAKMLLHHIVITAARVGTTASGAAAEEAIEHAAGLKSAFRAAKLSAIHTWEAVAKSGVGGPFNPIIAAAESAAVFAAVMAMAAFESGGIVPRTGIILAHEKEAVLPANLTTMLMGAANSRSTTQNSYQSKGGDSHFHYHASAGENPTSINRNIAALSRAHRDGKLRFA